MQIPCRSVGMRINRQEASHCFHAVLYLQGIEVESPSVTDFLAALYVSVASIHMEREISSRAWAVERWCGSVGEMRAPEGELVRILCLILRFRFQECGILMRGFSIGV